MQLLVLMRILFPFLTLEEKKTILPRTLILYLGIKSNKLIANVKIYIYVILLSGINKTYNFFLERYS